MSTEEEGFDGKTSEVVTSSPMPFVWGLCMDGEFWWFVQADRWILRPLNQREDAPRLELYNGCLCDTHGMEGHIAGIVTSFTDAWRWMMTGEVPEGGLIH